MNKAMLLKQYMFNNKKKGARLPSAYQEVEYIQGTGTQCINTGVTYSSTLKVDLDYSSQEILGDVDLFGIWVSSATGSSVDTGWVVGFAFGDRIRTVTGLGYNSNFSVSVPNFGGEARFSDNQVFNLNTKYNLTFDLTDNMCLLKRDGVIQKIIVKGSITSNAIRLQTCLDMYKEFPMYLFSRMQTYGFSKTTVYRCKIEREGVLVRDFIPCYRKSDNEVGLYDIVNNQFYTNQGSGTFLCGRPLVNIDGYEQLDYIYTNSTTERAFIDTGIARNTSDISIDIDFQQLETAKTLYTYFVSEGGNFPSAGSGWGFGNAQTNWSLIQPGVGYNTFGTIDTNRKKVNISLVGSTITISGDLSKSTTWSYYGTNQPYVDKNIWLFGAIQNSSAVKVFSCKIKKDNVLVRNFIPMRKISTNELGLYDLVNKVFYTNQGSGSFIAGGKI